MVVTRAARTIHIHHVNQDGLTAYRKWKGKGFRREVADFGETVLYLKPGTKGRDKLKVRWEQGIWLGILDEIGEVVVGIAEGVINVRDIKRFSSEMESWSRERLEGVAGTPWQTVPGPEKDNIPISVQFPKTSEAPIPAGGDPRTPSGEGPGLPGMMS